MLIGFTGCGKSDFFVKMYQQAGLQNKTKEHVLVTLPVTLLFKFHLAIVAYPCYHDLALGIQTDHISNISGDLNSPGTPLQ